MIFLIVVNAFLLVFDLTFLTTDKSTQVEKLH